MDTPRPRTTHLPRMTTTRLTCGGTRHHAVPVRRDGALVDRALPRRLRPPGLARSSADLDALGRPEGRLDDPRRYAGCGHAGGGHERVGLRAPLFHRLHG